MEFLFSWVIVNIKIISGKLDISAFNMILDKQLFRNYNELYELILCCYKDVSILQEYEKLQKEKRDWYNVAPNVSNYFVRLVQKDLASTLWKIYYDTNTVSKFRNTINESLRNSDCRYETVKKERTNRSTENKLKAMRHQFLAHADMKRDSSKIDICELTELLEAICREFNKVCDVIDDDKFAGISEINIGVQDMNYRMELLALYVQE